MKNLTPNRQLIAFIHMVDNCAGEYKSMERSFILLSKGEVHVLAQKKVYNRVNWN